MSDPSRRARAQDMSPLERAQAACVGWFGECDSSIAEFAAEFADAEVTAAVAAERERCAQIAYTWQPTEQWTHSLTVRATAADIAAAIRQPRKNTR